MTREALRTLARRCLADIAPDADLDGLDEAADLRRAIDIDSMDFLNFVIALHEATGVEIPESDYDQLRTFAGVVAYLERKSPRAEG